MPGLVCTVMTSNRGPGSPRQLTELNISYLVTAVKRGTFGQKLIYQKKLSCICYGALITDQNAGILNLTQKLAGSVNYYSVTQVPLCLHTSVSLI